MLTDSVLKKHENYFSQVFLNIFSSNFDKEEISSNKPFSH